MTLTRVSSLGLAMFTAAAAASLGSVAFAQSSVSAFCAGSTAYGPLPGTFEFRITGYGNEVNGSLSYQSVPYALRCSAIADAGYPYVCYETSTDAAKFGVRVYSSVNFFNQTEYKAEITYNRGPGYTTESLVTLGCR